MGGTPEIAVIVPAHRAAATLPACLAALTSQTLAPDGFEVLIVDSGEDGAESLVAERARNWNGRLAYHRAGPSGPGAKRNLGAERVSARYLAFTDSDCTPEPQWLEAGLPHLRSGASIVQGPTLTPDGMPPPPFTHAIYRPGPSPLYESCNIMYPAEEFRRAGGFPIDLYERTGSYTGEDTELAWNVRRRNGHVEFEPRAVVRHAVHPPDFGRHLRYEWQSRFFPRLLRRVPELRDELAGGMLLGRRSALSCGALAALALGRRRKWARALAAPYLLELVRMGRSAPGPAAAATTVAQMTIADGVREAALIWGSLRYASPVL